MKCQNPRPFREVSFLRQIKNLLHHFSCIDWVKRNLIFFIKPIYKTDILVSYFSVAAFIRIYQFKIVSPTPFLYCLLQRIIFHCFDSNYFLVFFCKSGNPSNCSSSSKSCAKIIKIFGVFPQHIPYTFHRHFITSTFGNNKCVWIFFGKFLC